MKKTYRKNLKGKNILVVGGAGFIGSHLCEGLIQSRVKRIIVLDDLSVGKKENLKEINDKIIFIKANAENYEIYTESQYNFYKDDCARKFHYTQVFCKEYYISYDYYHSQFFLLKFYFHLIIYDNSEHLRRICLIV